MSNSPTSSDPLVNVIKPLIQTSTSSESDKSPPMVPKMGGDKEITQQGQGQQQWVSQSPSTIDTSEVEVESDQTSSTSTVTTIEPQIDLDDSEEMINVSMNESGEEIYMSFPLLELTRLNEMISNPRWVVPVLPGGQLEILLEASIELSRKGLDVKSEPCQKFFREGLTVSFTKILTDDAVSSWKPDIHKCILRNSEKLIDLIISKLSQDCLPLLEILGILFNPNNKFHSFNACRQPDSYPNELPINDDELFARPIEIRAPKGWLVDLINRFGQQKGFEILTERFNNEEMPLSVQLVFVILKPFGLCAEYLTKFVIEKYFSPVLIIVPKFLESLSDDELKKETAKSDIISSIIKFLKFLQFRLIDSEDQNDMKNIELFRLRMILRMLQVSSFNGKMNALNEINQVIQNVTSYYPHHHHRLDEIEYLTAKRIAEWLSENQVLQIILRDSLHQPQYVEKMEKILRFIIKERTLTLKDLDDIWAAQVGKHDAIVKNVHDLLCKLAWDFSPEQLDHLFECFQASWTTANKRQREKLLELIRRLAEDDKDGVMAYKVLTLFWNLAHSNEVPTEIMDQALSAHVKVLDYSCSQMRDNQKYTWLNKIMNQLEENDVSWVIPAMKHMREIFSLYPEGNHKNSSAVFRTSIINRMQEERKLIIKVCDSLSKYMDSVRIFAKDKSLDPFQVKLDGRYPHVDQIRERLNFLRFLLKDGQLYLCENQANMIWQCLAETPAFSTDREMCFEWFSKLMGDDPDLESKLAQQFFENKILKFDPTLLTDSGMDCFERFFKVVNMSTKALFVKRDDVLMDKMELIGTEYIWRVILYGSEDIANRAINFIRATFTALGPNLIPNQQDVHEDFLSTCADRLKASYDTILILEKDKDTTNKLRHEVTKVCRVLRVFFEYIVECDSDYGYERAFIPLYRSCRGKNFSIYLRFSQGARGFEDMEVITHNNDSTAGLRRQILRQLKEIHHLSSFKIEFFYNGESIELNDDRKTVVQFGLVDKMYLQAKLIQGNVTNSPDSSEESSGGSPNHFQIIDGPNKESEESLPSVIMAMNEKRMEFLTQLCSLGESIGDERLREAARNLLSVLPPCNATANAIKNAFLKQTEKKPWNYIFNNDPSTVLYRLEILYSLLFPATNPESAETLELLQAFFLSGGAGVVVEMLTKNNFIPSALVSTKRAAYHIVLKLTKAVLAVALRLLILYEEEANKLSSDKLKIISEGLESVPNPSNEIVLRRVSEKLSISLIQLLKDGGPNVYKEGVKTLINSARQGVLPDIETIRLEIKIAQTTSSGSFTYISTDKQLANKDPSEEDVAICEEVLEVLTLSFLANSNALDQLINDSSWRTFIYEVLYNTSARSIRYIAHEQFHLIATKCSGNPNVMTFFINLLFDIVQNSAQDYPHHSREVFFLLRQLLRNSQTNPVLLEQYEKLLAKEIIWLNSVKEHVKLNGEGSVPEELLEGHLGVARELCSFLRPEKKLQIGSDNGLISEILEELVFPWSKAHFELKKSGIMIEPPTQPLCSTPVTQSSILDFLTVLCKGCYTNMSLTVKILTELFNYSNDGEGTLNEWEYVPPGNQTLCGFVGLKNAGATCYMNSVLQQLFMVESIKRGILGINIGFQDEGFEDCDSNSISGINNNDMIDSTDDRKNYNITILKQIQVIFGHLALSKLQFYVPNGLWKNFRLQGEPVNLREQQDAVEFFMSLVESVDDGLKALNEEQVMSKNLGGLFSDQKICKECPHRYSKEEPFSVISVDIRNHSNLLDSLEQYVKGELLEGADAYHCEHCNKKVVTVKRLCVKKLPPVLAIQLKRFEYDYERVCPIKYNDYFEFPRELDMEPYTVQGLAKIEGEIIEVDDTLLSQNTCNTYRLTGIVVHSGQASGGHYYSYISVKTSDGTWKWYKYDDGEVSECRMEDDEELKSQCFGGDYAGEVFDHMMKRMSFRRQKRWWNAYILFFQRYDYIEENTEKFLIQQSDFISKMQPYLKKERRLKIPSHIEKAVLKQNVEFMHIRSHFSPEYFQFIRKLVGCNADILPADNYYSEEAEQLSLLSVQLATQFLFSVGFRTKKTLRGLANDWYEIIAPYLKKYKKCRFWFATYALFRDPCRIGEFLLECPSSDVRTAFGKMLVFLSHFSRDDGPYVPSIPMATLSRSSEKPLWEYIITGVLNLLRRDVSEYGRHLAQYFSFFVNYSMLGRQEKAHLIQFEVPSRFMLLALEEGPAPPIKYQCADLTKLFQVVSILIRSCDLSSICSSFNPDEPLKPNPFREITLHSDPALPLPNIVCDVLFGRGTYCSGYIKKLFDDAYSSEDTIALLQFLSWENPSYSQMILAEVLGHIGYSYTPELKAYLDILLSLLRLEDSWQVKRLTDALKGIPDEKDGLIEIIHRNKQSHPKRAYLFIKCVTNFIEPESIGHKIIMESCDLLKKWNASVEWLEHELERRAPAGSYGYGTTTSWSPPSNESSNGSFFLERSLSAKTTLEKAVELRIREQVDNDDEQISSEGEEEGDKVTKDDDILSYAPPNSPPKLKIEGKKYDTSILKYQSLLLEPIKTEQNSENEPDLKELTESLSKLNPNTTVSVSPSNPLISSIEGESSETIKAILTPIVNEDQIFSKTASTSSSTSTTANSSSFPSASHSANDEKKDKKGGPAEYYDMLYKSKIGALNKSNDQNQIQNSSSSSSSSTGKFRYETE